MLSRAFRSEFPRKPGKDGLQERGIVARIGTGKLGVAVVAAGMMLLGISNPAYAAPRSPSAEITSATGGLSAAESHLAKSELAKHRVMPTQD